MSAQEKIRTYSSISTSVPSSRRPTGFSNLVLATTITYVTTAPNPSIVLLMSSDQSDVVVDPAPKVVLQNRLVRCRGKLGELKPVIDSKRTQHQWGRFMAF